MKFEDYQLLVHRNHPDAWVAEIPAIAGCHALMDTCKRQGPSSRYYRNRACLMPERPSFGSLPPN